MEDELMEAGFLYGQEETRAPASEDKPGPVLPVPTGEEVESTIKRRNDTEPFAAYERAIDRVFEVLPGNSSTDDILPKAAVLNEFCSLNIRSVLPVAEHIAGLGLDNALDSGDPMICDRLATVRMRNGREYNFYTFATKYLAHSRPEIYPEYDNLAAKVLAYFRDRDDFSRFLLKELKEYSRFRQIFLEFRRKYGLEAYSLRDIHTYLWMTGLENFTERRREVER